MVCQMTQFRGGLRVLSPVASLRVVPGAESLARIAAGYTSSSDEHSNHPVFRGLRIFGRTRVSGHLLALSPSTLRPRPSSTNFSHGHLRPEFAIDGTNHSQMLRSDQDIWEGEQLFAVGMTVLSLSPASRSIQEAGDTCQEGITNRPAGQPLDALKLRTWNLSSGESAVHRLPSWQPWLQDSAAALLQLCSGRLRAAQTSSGDLLSL